MTTNFERRLGELERLIPAPKPAVDKEAAAALYAAMLNGPFERPRENISAIEAAGDKLFTFTRFPQSQWKSIRTSNAIERLHEEFKRRIKTQAVLPCAETAAMLFWALMASGQIVMRKVDGWQSLGEKPADQIIDLAA
jgi:transposase-like protein